MADELERVCIRLWADDYRYLKAMRQNMGLNMLIRQIVHSYVVHVKDQEQKQLNKVDDLTDLEPLNLNLDDFNIVIEERP